MPHIDRAMYSIRLFYNSDQFSSVQFNLILIGKLKFYAIAAVKIQALKSTRTLNDLLMMFSFVKNTIKSCFKLQQGQHQKLKKKENRIEIKRFFI